jgi:hypothetical protein
VPARRTTTRSPSSSHSKTEPGARPSLRRTAAGTEICPWAVSLDDANDMRTHYHGNGLDAKVIHGKSGDHVGAVSRRANSRRGA